MNGSVSTIVRVRFPGRGRLYTDTFSVRAYIRSRMRYRVRLGREMPCWDRCFSCRTLSRAWRVVLLTTINCYRVRSRCFVCRVLRTRSYARYTRELRSRRRQWPFWLAFVFRYVFVGRRIAERSAAGCSTKPIYFQPTSVLTYAPPPPGFRFPTLLRRLSSRNKYVPMSVGIGLFSWDVRAIRSQTTACWRARTGVCGRDLKSQASGIRVITRNKTIYVLHKGARYYRVTLCGVCENAAEPSGDPVTRVYTCPSGPRPFTRHFTWSLESSPVYIAPKQPVCMVAKITQK